jgi:hypothetical protein
MTEYYWFSFYSMILFTFFTDFSWSNSHAYWLHDCFSFAVRQTTLHIFSRKIVSLLSRVIPHLHRLERLPHRFTSRSYQLHRLSLFHYHYDTLAFDISTFHCLFVFHWLAFTDTDSSSAFRSLSLLVTPRSARRDTPQERFLMAKLGMILLYYSSISFY